jgi:glycogen debranching enzyme
VNGKVILRRGDLHVFRSKFIWQAACYETIELVNYSLSPVELSFTLQYDADFADIFEVRGVKRKERGHRLPDELGSDRALLAYRGLDHVLRKTEIQFSPAPENFSASRAYFRRILNPGKHENFEIVYRFDIGGKPASPRPREVALQAAEQSIGYCKGEDCDVHTTNREFNRWLNRSTADLHMMISRTEHGLYPYAGVPWYSTVFGRDGILTAWFFLWVNARVARDVLSYLAAYQATEIIPERDATPGKILHEVRRGEMAALNEIPFGLYYGSTDATPLFIMLAGAYYERTGDLSFIDSIWPQIALALEWIDRHGDVDDDGFVETVRQSARGLVQQGWKDSWDAISHADGSLPEGPIALCEVQAYAYAAKQTGARLATSLGHLDLARALLEQARALKQKFNEVFWCEELASYALALDGDKRPCRVVASNAGHALFAGIASEEYARRVAARLMSEDMFTGWGVRTLSSREVRYNPMSYHNGSVWPHDNAMIARGLANYGCKNEVNQILTGLFDASLFFEMERLPELFCGFRRREGEGPTHYPAACAPQAWASAAVFMLLQASLGLSINGVSAEVNFMSPLLPPYLDKVYVKNLRVGNASVDLVRDRSIHGVAVERREGEAAIVIR